MLDPHERQHRLRIAVVAGVTAFVLVAAALLLMTPAAADAAASHRRWDYVLQIAIPSSLLTMSLTWFLMRRRG